jgi:predicted Fe-Mo cluster-binding NifX family protein
MEKFKIAVATKAREGLDDEVSEVFGRASAFAVVDVEEGEIKDVDVLENPAISYKHGAGPIVVKMLVDSGVNVVVGAELGPGASALLEQHSVVHVIVKPGINVRGAIGKALAEVKK